MSTTGFWLTIPAELYKTLPFAPEQRINGLFGLSYLLHHVAPLFLMCDLHDLGVAIGDNFSGDSVPPRELPGRQKSPRDSERFSKFFSPDFSPNIFLYDNFPGGIGLSPVLFELHKILLEACLKTIEACPCEEGCPSCVGPEKESGEKAKQVAEMILKKLLFTGA
jgi:Distinct helicase family with a unique C-terminal domain including a metal-binding cysteine cluster